MDRLLHGGGAQRGLGVACRRLLTLVSLSAVLVACDSLIGIPETTCDPAFDVGCSCGPDVSLCDCYCSTVLGACTADDAVYGARDECLATCSALESSARLVDAVECRLQYGVRAAQSNGEERAALCSAAGPTGRTVSPLVQAAALGAGSLQSGGVACEQESCDAFCVMMSEACREDYIACHDECHSRQQDREGFDVGDYRPVAEGDTLQCRVYHAYRAGLHLSRGHTMNVQRSCGEVVSLCVDSGDAGVSGPGIAERGAPDPLVPDAAKKADAAPESAGKGDPTDAGSPGVPSASTGDAGAGGQSVASPPGAVSPTATNTPAPPACSLEERPQPSDGVACRSTCTDPCGVHRLGSRVCTCSPQQEVFECEGCVFADSDPLLEPPATAFSYCSSEDGVLEDDGKGCTENSRCQSLIASDRFCGCRQGSWDCDTKPDTFQY